MVDVKQSTAADDLFQQDVSPFRRWIASHKFTVLLGSILMLLLAIPMVDELENSAPVLVKFEAYVIPSLFTFIMVLAVHALSQNRRMLILAIITGVFALPMQWADVFVDFQWVQTFRLVMIIAFLLLVTASILWSVLTSKAVDGDTLSGAMCVYLLIGLAGGCCYLLVESLSPMSIQYVASVVDSQNQPIILTRMSSNDNFDNMVYFSFVCMTTLGFGDIVPVSTTAKTLAYLQAILGQFYLAVLVARLVGMHLAGGILRRDDSEHL